MSKWQTCWPFQFQLFIRTISRVPSVEGSYGRKENDRSGPKNLRTVTSSSFFYSFSFLSFLFSASFSFPVIFFSSLLPSFLSFFLPNEIPTTPVRYPVYNWLASVPSITFRLDCRSRLRFSNGAGANEKKEKRKNERKKEREKENWKGRGSLLLLLITRLIFVWTFYSLCLCRYFTQFSITGGYGGGSDGGGVPP